MSLMWSTILRLIISDTFQSQQRLPASMWKMGIFSRFAEMADRALLVSPSSSTASGRWLAISA